MKSSKVTSGEKYYKNSVNSACTTLNCVHSVVELLEDMASVLAQNSGIRDEMNVTVLAVTGNNFSIIVERVSGHCMEKLNPFHYYMIYFLLSE